MKKVIIIYYYSNLSFIYIYIYIYINSVMICPSDVNNLPMYCTIITVEMMGYAVDSLYPTREINDTINEVIRIK